ncbi:MAG: hypothetical protein ABI379_09445 [Rhodanobacter sp.]
MIILYLGLLVCGAILFALSFVAQWCVARRMRKQHPRQWQIIAVPEDGRATSFQVWIRLQRALQSPVLPALDDAQITNWRRVWRFAPGFGWLFWVVAVGMRLLAH